MSSISRVLRIKFGKKEEDDDGDKKDDDGEKKAKHSIDGILGDKGRDPPAGHTEPGFPTHWCAGGRGDSIALRFCAPDWRTELRGELAAPEPLGVWEGAPSACPGRAGSRWPLGCPVAQELGCRPGVLAAGPRVDLLFIGNLAQGGGGRGRRSRPAAP